MGIPMEFVLALKDGLARESARPSADQLDYMASGFLIPLEYDALDHIVCPVCAKQDWEPIMQSALTRRADLDWPYSCPGGDRHESRCKSCGHSMTVTFWFTDD